MIHSDKKHYVVFGTLALLIVLLVVANLFLGSVNIPAQEVLRILSGEEAEKASWTFIVWESRFPQCITALLCGAALSASGLMLQTVFSNPLADSSSACDACRRRNHCHRCVYTFRIFLCHIRRIFGGCSCIGFGLVFILFDKK